MNREQTLARWLVQAGICPDCGGELTPGPDNYCGCDGCGSTYLPANPATILFLRNELRLLRENAQTADHGSPLPPEGAGPPATRPEPPATGQVPPPAMACRYKCDRCHNMWDQPVAKPMPGQMVGITGEPVLRCPECGSVAVWTSEPHFIL